MVRQIIILAVMLASVSFFNLVFFPRQVLLVLSFGSTLFMAVALVIGIIYNKGKGFKQNFGLEVFFFLLAAVFGMFGALWGHGQSLLLSAWIQQSMYFYLFYFFLHMIRIRGVDFEKLLILMAFIFAFLFFVQFVITPTRIINVRISHSRGTVRIFMAGLLFGEMIFYYFLNRFFRTNNLKNAIFVVFT